MGKRIKIKTQNFKNSAVLILSINLLALCCQNLDIERELKVSKTTISNIGPEQVSVNSCIFDGGEGITSYGHCWSTLENPSLIDNTTSFHGKDSLNSFTSNIQNLLPNKTYYIRAYATYNKNTFYGEEVIVKAFGFSPPIVMQTSFEKITNTIVKITGRVKSFGGTSNIKDHGICWSRDSIPTITDFKDSKGFCDDFYSYHEFSCYVVDLDTNVLYYFRTYAINDYYISYGDVFNYNSNYATPIVEASIIDNLTTSHSATIEINVIHNGNLPIDHLSFRLHKCSDSSIVFRHYWYDTEDVYQKTVHDLTPNTCYFIKGSAENTWGYGHSSSVTFKTLPQ